MEKWTLKCWLDYWESNLKGIALELPVSEFLNGLCLLDIPDGKEGDAGTSCL